ncbi:unnamed protein product [Pieris macdunnoughi]|uniref:Uncharacterized protein n=1 Tax=Pieris macdunnoughi TaxID=345717 RepID=A0A821UA46_9NEOP|nr:unnamed protein product [Pieris macdunnoughi]
MITIMLLAIVVSCTSITGTSGGCTCPCPCYGTNTMSSGRAHSLEQPKTVRDYEDPLALLKRFAFTHRIKDQKKGDEDEFINTGNEVGFGM